MIIERMLFSLILAPYLINVSKLSYDAALNIINSWLSKCGKVRQLDQDFDYMGIKRGITVIDLFETALMNELKKK